MANAEDAHFTDGGQHPCVGCGQPFRPGDTAYGVTNHLGEHRLIHARCLPTIGAPTN